MWDQMALFSQPDHPYTVSEITGRIRALLEQEPLLQNVWIEGEVSNFSRASSGHIYFTLKDAGAQMNGVVWRSQAQSARRTSPVPAIKSSSTGASACTNRPGATRFTSMQSALPGAARSSRSSNASRRSWRPKGCSRRSASGPCPRTRAASAWSRRPRRQRSATCINVLTRRYPLAEVLLAPTLVQGETAPPQIVAALAALNARAAACDRPDVILIVRGGGSLEDLWAFNDERVARAVAASRIPVISGVGHETDFTLTDFAADHRAPTPSAAAEMATPDRAELQATAATASRCAAGAHLRRRNCMDLPRPRSAPSTRVSSICRHRAARQRPAARGRPARPRGRSGDASPHWSMQRQAVQGLTARLAAH
jgi:exodeoxyribonuclease VII large subunit